MECFSGLLVCVGKGVLVRTGLLLLSKGMGELLPDHTQLQNTGASRLEGVGADSSMSVAQVLVLFRVAAPLRACRSASSTVAVCPTWWRC